MHVCNNCGKKFTAPYSIFGHLTKNIILTVILVGLVDFQTEKLKI